MKVITLTNALDPYDFNNNDKAVALNINWVAKDKEEAIKVLKESIKNIELNC